VSTDLEPYRVDIPQEQLDDLADRLRRTRWPERETVHDWSQGLPLAYAKELCAYWADSYDWRRFEAELNALPQFRTDLEGLPVHLLHVRSPHEGALPLLLTHGWPGSIVEFLDVLGPLTDPPDPADAFHVVCPTLPGYGFSAKPTGTGWNVTRVARAWAALMARLGYGRYAAQGGDWGSMVTAALGSLDAPHLAGIHLTMPVAAPAGDPARLSAAGLSAADQEKVAAMRRQRGDGSGYARQQSTRPQTLGYGLVDSPAGQCAWIVEKFREWTDCDGHPENVIARDRLLDNVMLYWLPGAATSSARLYWESYRDASLDPVAVPTGVSLFPHEIFRTPRPWAERRFTDLRYWKELDRGGHFASLEQPEVFVRELREFFRTLR
jgi:epoxide hydrolase